MTTPAQEQVRANIVTMKIVEIEGYVFSDQTGRFPIASSRGMKYIIVLFDNATNAILETLMKSRSQEEIVRAQVFLHDLLTKRGFKPQTQILDKKCPNKLKEFFAKRKVHFQLVPPHLHCTNAEERAIATFKDHLVAGLASMDPAFPLHLWCCLINQAITTLNLMRSIIIKHHWHHPARES